MDDSSPSPKEESPYWNTSLLEYFPLWRRKTHTLDYRLFPLCFPARNSERDGVFLLTQSSHSTQHTAFLFSIALRSLFMRHLLFLPKPSTPTPYSPFREAYNPSNELVQLISLPVLFTMSGMDSLLVFAVIYKTIVGTPFLDTAIGSM